MADQQLAVRQEERAALEVRQQVNELQYLMANVLKPGEHYGNIPGTKGKPTLLQSGAEKICLMFKLVPAYEVSREELGGGHREYTVTCTLAQRGSGITEGSGMGSCSTLESKYRYRNQWENGQKRRVENPDIADVYNTVLKMAKKRALVDAVKSTTAASDIFTQDVEDLPAWMLSHRPSEAPRTDANEKMDPAPAQEDIDWLKSATDGLAAQGYKPDEVKPFLWARYKEGGIDGARQAYESMLAVAGQAQDAEQAALAGQAEAEAQAIEADEIELAQEDIEF